MLQIYGFSLSRGRFFPNFYIFALQINNDMKYLEIDFFIDIDAALMDDARALLAEAAGEAGCESFEDSEQGLKAYVQVDL